MPERTGLAISAAGALVGVGILAAGWGVFINIDEVASRLEHIFDRAPWPLLLTAAATVGAVKLFELRRRARAALGTI